MIGHAQNAARTGAACFTLKNTSPQKIVGAISTDSFKTPDGQERSHVSNFRLEPGEGRDVCAAGPFFHGRFLEVTLRSLFPLFSCYVDPFDVDRVNIESIEMERQGIKVKQLISRNCARILYPKRLEEKLAEQE